MKKEIKISGISNLKRGWAARGAALVLPAFVVVLALGGVTARPVLDATRARDELEIAKRRVEECRAERDQWERHRAARTVELADTLRDRMRARFPSEMTDVVAHGTVRIVAQRRGVELDRLQVGADRDAGLGGETERIVLREVALAGRASLADVVGLVDDLRALGFPTCINEVTLRRAMSSSEFEFNLVIGLMHLAPPTVNQDQAPWAQEQP